MSAPKSWLAFLLLLAISSSACAGAGVAGLTGPSVTPPTAPAGPSGPSIGSAAGFVVFDVDYGSLPAKATTEVDRRWKALQLCAGVTVPPFAAPVPLMLHAFTQDAAGAAGFQSIYGPVSGFYVDRRHGGPDVHVLGDPGWSVAWSHELLHLLLDLTTGDADGKHQSPLFAKCTDHLASFDFSRDAQ